ncbi:MAG: DinB family protein [Ginsengibacter sp.]|jgi:uncharacterized damage-inducible protein DinB
MYRKITDFLSDWQMESENTLKVFSKITDASLNEKEHENIRSMGTLSWHMAGFITEVLKMAGLQIDGPDVHSKPPSSIKEIIEGYKKVSASLTKEVKSKWNDASLDEVVDIFGNKIPKGKALFLLVVHQAHHRGQLTILIRLAGLKVPGVYGPAKEEWALMNMPAMD